MVIIAVIVVLMWMNKFPMEYAFIAIIFASIVLILRLGYRFYIIFTKKKRG